jgi:hypothetical protein
MATTPKPLVDDELYVNDATLEALRNVIEAEVRASLRRTVLWPLLVAGIALLVFAAIWLIPNEIKTLMRDDPVVEQRFSRAAGQAMEEYIADPERGRLAIQQEVRATLQADQNMQDTVNTAASAAVADLDLEAVVQAQVEARLDEEIRQFLSTEEGRDLIDEAVREYFGTEAGKATVDSVASEALSSPDFRRELGKDLDNILRP